MGRFFNRRLIPASIGFLFTLILSALLLSRPPKTNSWIETFENWAYDFIILSGAYKEKNHTHSISIVDIDDRSIDEIGRWPWPRDRIGALFSAIHKMGAAVIASDILFAEPEENVIDEVIAALPSDQAETRTELDRLRKQFDHDVIFAKSIGESKAILSCIFTNALQSKGLLPPPLLDIKGSEEALLGIMKMKSYYANLPILQRATPYGGFINSTPDMDGVLRYAPILIRYEDQIYPSLGLKAAALFLYTDKIDLFTPQYKSVKVLEGVRLDKIMVPTDPWGRMLIPYRGAPFSFPRISGTDLLHGKIGAESIKDKIIFVGSSATAIGDLKATPLSPVTMGTEVHAFIAAGIIDQYLPYKPIWGRGVSLVGVVIAGIFCSIVFPLLGPFLLTLFTAVLSAAIFAIVYFLWISHTLVVPFLFPLDAILFLYLFNLIYGYFSEMRREREIKDRFSLFVPPEYVNIMLKKGGDYKMEGESKELSILFTDIRNFVHLSEKMKASELKQFLNIYLTPITQTIFEYKGTIDKYVGDLVMAFWGAPLPNPKHASDAIGAGLAIQETIQKLNTIFQEKNLPTIQTGVGINTGVVSVGDMGSKFRRAYTVLGDNVNTASRLESITKVYPVNILVGENTWEQAKEDYLFRKVDKVRLKGRSDGMYIYQPICRKDQADQSILTELQKYALAMELYWKQDWDGAEKAFLELKEISPKNGRLYEIFLGRIREFRSHPPPEQWDGVHVLEEK